ncbi:neprilysin-4-like, partial [Condylostylus longicornis]|uniref:neprilysin-4-like n=1 Tax=Condylostylus longicornis TaxID=2530218 RepID=UPI00244DD107
YGSPFEKLVIQNNNNTFKNEFNLKESILNNDELIEYLQKEIFLKHLQEKSINQYELISKYMDKSADPCEDFYQYACGNWEKYHEIPLELPSYDIFAILNEELQKSLHEILTYNQNKTMNSIINNQNSSTDEIMENDTKNFDMEQQVNLFFASCSNIDLINERKFEPMLEVIKEIGGFPLLDGDEWSEENFNLEEVLAWQSIHQMHSFFSTEIEYDLKNIEKSVIYMLHPELGLRSHADYLESYNKAHLEGYREFIKDVFEILNTPENETQNVIDEIIDLEMKLAKLTDVRTNNYEVQQLYNPTTVGILKEKYSKFNWTEYLIKIFNKEFNDDYKIVIFGAPKTDEIFDLLINTDKRIIANYINWRTIQQMLKYLDERFKAPKVKFTKILMGSEKTTKERTYLCAGEVNEAIGMAVSSLYVKKYFNENCKDDVSKMTEEISKVFRSNLNLSDWIDDETKLLAEEKVNKTLLAVGYPEFILNKTELNDYYNGINFAKDKYFENVLNLRKYENIKERNKLEKKVDKNEWPIRPTIINAFFEQAKNRIIMPAAILQPPVYHGDFPKSLNYGAIGVFIGHELTHGFDTVGRGFDQDGNMNDWWTNKSYEQFKDRAQCFIDQYSQFKIYNKTLNGEITKEENIADNGGIRLSFKVYKEWLKTATEEEIKAEAVPNLDLSPLQLFFVAFAQSWCEHIRPEAIENRLETDTHPPGKFRIIGTLQNFEEFSNAYECPLNTTMNPIKKCKLW